MTRSNWVTILVVLAVLWTASALFIDWDDDAETDSIGIPVPTRGP